ncbi:MAG: hypothetical protein ABH823_04565 [bacterium]
MNKKLVVGMFLIALASIVVIGCSASTGGEAGGTPTTTTTTTNAALNEAASDAGTAAGAAGTAASGIGSLGESLGGVMLTNSTGGAPGVSATGIQTMVAAPVSQLDPLFETKTAAWNGVTTIEGIIAGSTVEVTLTTSGGATVDGTLLTASPTKQIVDITGMTGITWENLLAGNITESNFAVGVLNWSNAPDYENVNSVFDYVLWSTVLDSVEDYFDAILASSTVRTALGASTDEDVPTELGVELNTPAATADDKLAGFSGTFTLVTGEGEDEITVDLTYTGTMTAQTFTFPISFSTPLGSISLDNFTTNVEVPTAVSGSGTITSAGNTTTINSFSLALTTTVDGTNVGAEGSMTITYDDDELGVIVFVFDGTLDLTGETDSVGVVTEDGTTIGSVTLNFATGTGNITIAAESIDKDFTF